MSLRRAEKPAILSAVCSLKETFRAAVAPRTVRLPSTEFLKNLRDPGGNPFYFERLGSCCPFKDPQGRRSGLLDVYGIVMKGTRRMILLYVSLYAPMNEPIYIPMCFKYQKDLPRLNY